jgi:hypothetical protein
MDEPLDRPRKKDPVIQQKALYPLLAVGPAVMVLGLFGLALIANPRTLVAGLMIGGFFILTGLALTALAVVQLVLLRPCLVFTRDHLQLRWGLSMVRGQVPYGNIASVEMADRVRYVRDDRFGEREHHYWVLEVILFDNHNPETFWPFFSRGAHDFEIEDTYTETMTVIRRKILQRVEKSRQRHRDLREGPL